MDTSAPETPFANALHQRIVLQMIIETSVCLCKAAGLIMLEGEGNLGDQC